jgi:hypothetical protein
MAQNIVNIYITSVGGQLVAEVDGEKRWELCDTISNFRLGFGESYEVESDFDDDYNDIWCLKEDFEDHLSAIAEGDDTFADFNGWF